MLCPTNWYEWVVFAAATALLFFPGLLHSWTPVPKLGADFIGIALVALVYLSQRMRIKKDPSLTLPIYERHKLEEAAA